MPSFCSYSPVTIPAPAPNAILITGTGRFAKLSATVENGEVTDIRVVRGGSGYTQGVTNVKVLPGGFGANFNANIHKWNINTVERYKSILQLGPNQEPNVYKQTVQLPSDYSDQIALWDEKNIEYNFEGEKIDWTSWLLGFAPWLLLIAFWLFLIRRMQGSGNGMNNVFSFGKSKAMIFSGNSKNPRR